MTDLLQLLVQGLALGAVYALVALGFVVIYKATGVINFAHGELMLLGAYLVFALRAEAGLPFAIALPLAMGLMAAVGWGVERALLRRMVGRPIFSAVMITIGLAIVLRQAVAARFGYDERIIGDPWGAATLSLAGVQLNVVSVATVAAAGVLVVVFFAFFRGTRAGVAMRAAAFDQEAALAVGIPVRRVAAWSWMIAAATATVAGIFLAAFPSNLSPALGFAAFRAFPAAILGGLDSPGGAIVGGLVIGVVEVLVQGYQPLLAPWLGVNVHVVTAYVLMIGVLLVRPYGLFGTPQVERV